MKNLIQMSPPYEFQNFFQEYLAHKLLQYIIVIRRPIHLEALIT